MAALKGTKSKTAIAGRIKAQTDAARVYLHAPVEPPPPKPGDQLERVLDFYRLYMEADSQTEMDQWMSKILDYLELINRMHAGGERLRILGQELEERRRTASLDVFSSGSGESQGHSRR